MAFGKRIISGWVEKIQECDKNLGRQEPVKEK